MGGTICAIIIGALIGSVLKRIHPPRGKVWASWRYDRGWRFWHDADD